MFNFTLVIQFYFNTWEKLNRSLRVLSLDLLMQASNAERPVLTMELQGEVIFRLNTTIFTLESAVIIFPIIGHPMKFTKIITYFLFRLLAFTCSTHICEMAAYSIFRRTLNIWLHNYLTAATFLSTKPACLKRISLILNTTKSNHSLLVENNKGLLVLGDILILCKKIKTNKKPQTLM